MQVCLHGITLPEVQDDIDLSDLLNCLCLAVTMQDRTPHAPAILVEIHDTTIPMTINSGSNNDRSKSSNAIDWNSTRYDQN